MAEPRRARAAAPAGPISVRMAADLTDATTLLATMIGASGQTQKRLAATLGITEKHLSQMKLGRTRLTVAQLLTIADLCGYRLTLTADLERAS